MADINLPIVNCRNFDIDSIIKLDSDVNDKLTVFTINIRGLRGKFTELLGILNLISVNFTFIVVTEVWISEGSNAGFQIPNYKTVHSLRNDRGGGIIVYYRDNLDIEIIQEKTGIFPSHEALLLSCNITGIGDMYLWCFYRPPGLSAGLFNLYLETNLPFVLGTRTILTGDFNFDTLLSRRTVSIQDFVDIMISFGFFSCIDKPTYFSPVLQRPTSCLDNFWQNINMGYLSYVIYPPVSDHMGIILSVDFGISTKNKIKINFRDYSIRNKNKFLENINLECQLFRLNSNDANIETTRFVTWMKFLTNKYFKLKSKFITDKRLSAPWMSRQILKCILKKHRWFKLLKGKIITYSTYCDYSKLLRKLLKCAERKYYENKFKNLSKNLPKKWNLINNMLKNDKPEISKKFIVNGELTTEKEVIAQYFIDYFASIPNAINAQLPTSDLDGLAHVVNQPQSMYLHPSTADEIGEIILSLKNSSAEQDIIIKVLKLGLNHFSELISELFNLCANESSYPGCLKIARITPVHKGGKRSCFSNYRPISILSNLNKIFEKILCKRINSFIGAFNVLSSRQFGFRKGLGTEAATLQLISHILPAFENQMFSICLYLDFSKAFDTVDHKLLIKKLEKNGIRGYALHIIESYLNGRKQYVNYKGVSSDLRSVSVGVPQGSCLGPLLFNLYTNDLHDFINGIDDVMYADDTTLVASSDDLLALQERMNAILIRVFEWCKFNRLALNVSKTKAMLFTNRPFVPPVISVNYNPIEFVTEFKYLGLLFDPKLKFNKHLASLYSTLSRYNGLSFRLGSYFSLDSAKSFYYAFFYSSVTYCLTVWGGLLMCTQKGNRLHRLQRRIIKNLFNKYFVGFDYNHMLKELEILKLTDVYILRVSCLMFKMLKKNMYPSLLLYIAPNVADHGYYTRQNNQYVLPLPIVENVRASFKYQFLNIWNNIPENIKSENSYGIFKNKLKISLLNNYM